MRTSIRRLLLAALLFIPVGWLQAQENKHAQAMHTAFIEAIHGKYTKGIKAQLKRMNEDSLTVAWGQWGALDGGGLVPKEKIHVVKLSKSKSNVAVAVGPLYIDGHRFRFEQVPDDPTLPLRPLLDAFDKQARYANSYYSYVAGDEQATFPGISIAWGEEGQAFPLQLHPSMNVRIIGFKDDDGFRSTYLLTWLSSETDSVESSRRNYEVEGLIYEFHCPKMTAAPQVKSYDPDEYLNRMNTSLGVAHSIVNQILKYDTERQFQLLTDTVAEKSPYVFHKMLQRLFNVPVETKLNTGYNALLSKVRRMAELSSTANPTELKAICYTLHQEMSTYPFMLSHRHAAELQHYVKEIADVIPEELEQHVLFANHQIENLENQTADIDSLSEIEQEYLNRNFWKLCHGPVKYQPADSPWPHFVAQGAHYTGDTHQSYLEVQFENYPGFHAEYTIHNLPPGRYRMSAVVRADKAEHSGIYIFCETDEGLNTELYQREIPGDNNTGGNVWFSAYFRYMRGVNKGEVNAMDINKATANGGQGFGWNRIYIDDIIVRDGTLTYGVSTRPEITNSHQFGSRWFSACDFIVERVGD